MSATTPSVVGGAYSIIHTRMAQAIFDMLSDAVREAVAEEREACARVAETAYLLIPGSPTSDEALNAAAKTIRARKP